MQMSRIVFIRAVKTKNTKTMVANKISVDDTVQIDGQDYGTVTEVIFRGFATLYMVRILDSSFEVGSKKSMQEGDQ